MVDLDLVLPTVEYPADVIVRDSIHALAYFPELVKVREGMDSVVQAACEPTEDDDRVLLLQLHLNTGIA